MKPLELLLVVLPFSLTSVSAQDLPSTEPPVEESSDESHQDQGSPTLEDGDGHTESDAADESKEAEDLPVYADGWQVWRRDGVLPAGLAHGGLVDVGQFGLELRYSHTTWSGMRDGRQNFSSQELFDSGYSIVGTELRESRLEIDLLYGLDPRWILYATLPVIERELSYDMAAGGSRRTDSSGIGDIKFGGRYAARADKSHQLQYTFGVSLPTGDYDERGSYAGNSNALLPYALQLGTGTVDLYPGITFLRMHDNWTFGARSEARVHLRRNSDDWAVSDSLQADAWASKTLTEDLVGDVRLQANWWGDYHGSAPELNRARSPLEDASRQGGSLVQIVLGLAVDFSDSYAGRNRLGIEIGVPIDEWVDGPGLSRRTSLLLSWRLGL